MRLLGRGVLARLADIGPRWVEITDQVGQAVGEVSGVYHSIAPDGRKLSARENDQGGQAER